MRIRTLLGLAATCALLACPSTSKQTVDDGDGDDGAAATSPVMKGAKVSATIPPAKALYDKLEAWKDAFREAEPGADPWPEIAPHVDPGLGMCFGKDLVTGKGKAKQRTTEVECIKGDALSAKRQLLGDRILEMVSSGPDCRGDGTCEAGFSNTETRLAFREVDGKLLIAGVFETNVAVADARANEIDETARKWIWAVAGVYGR